jgi:hypothetical protein
VPQRESTHCGRSSGSFLKLLNRVYFEKRCFSCGLSWSFTPKAVVTVQGSRLRRTSTEATRRLRSSAVGWPWWQKTMPPKVDAV